MIRNEFISSKIFVVILLLLFSSISTKVLAEPASEAWLIVGVDSHYSTPGQGRSNIIKIMNPSASEADVRCLKFNSNGGLVISATEQKTIPSLGTRLCASIVSGTLFVISDTPVLVTANTNVRIKIGSGSLGYAWQIESYPIEVEPDGTGLMCSDSAYKDFEPLCAIISGVNFGNNDTVPSP